MIVIGLLIGGVLKGQQLIENSRITATVAQVQGYRAANISFRDMYNAMPGDMSAATTRLPGCTAANNCFDGDGDGTLGTISSNYSHDDQSASSALPAVETSMYWKHLSAAGLITGVALTSDPAAPAWGSTHPSAKIGGGFHVLQSDETGGNEAVGVFYVLRLNVTGDPNAASPGLEVLSPMQALSLDTKMDDGIANTGEVRSDDGSGKCSNPGTAVYKTPSQSKDCLMLFNLQR